MWAVKRLINFKVESNCPLPFYFEDMKPIGYLPVYEFLADAQADYPDATYFEVREVKEG